MANGKPYLPNLEPYIAAGINPATSLPIKFSNPETIKTDIKKLLRITDEQDAVNRFKWTNLPANITSQELERMIYYKGQLCFYLDKNTGKYYFMPYTLDGTIDYYGRYNRIHPVPFSGGKESGKPTTQDSYLSTIKLDCIYTENQLEEIKEPSNCTVLLHDYTKQLSQTCLPRCDINDPLLDVMAECIPYMRTSLINATGVKGVRVNDADQADSVRQANHSLKKAALTGEQMTPVIGDIDFQELADGQVGKSEEFMLAFQSLDNYRLSLYGIQNGGVFEKKSHTLESEQEVNGGPIHLRANDGLEIRQNFVKLANKIFGLNMQVEEVELQSQDNAPEETGEGDSKDDTNV